MPVGVGLFGVLDLRRVSTSYQGKAEMALVLLFLAALAIGFWLGRRDRSRGSFKALPSRRW